MSGRSVRRRPLLRNIIGDIKQLGELEPDDNNAFYISLKREILGTIHNKTFNEHELDYNSFTPLMVAIKVREIEVANAIIDSGMSNLNHIQNIEDGLDLTALYIAVYDGISEIALKIIATGEGLPGHPNYEGVTPLILACDQNMDDVANALIDTGNADIGAVNNVDGRTALIYACQNNSTDVAIKLINSGNSLPFLVDFDGDTALDFAIQNNNQQLIDILTPLVRETEFIDLNANGFHAASGEDKNIQEFLSSNFKNICFLVDGRYYLTTLQELNNQMVNTMNIKYACIQAGENQYDENDELVGTNYTHESNIDESIKYFSMTSVIGLQILVNYDDMKFIVKEWNSSKYFSLKPSGFRLPSIISQAYLDGTIGSSADHCQTGKETEVYDIIRISAKCGAPVAQTVPVAPVAQQQSNTIKIQYKGQVIELPIRVNTTVGELKNILLNKLVETGSIQSTNQNVRLIYKARIYDKPEQNNISLSELANPPFGIVISALVAPVTGGKKRKTKRHMKINKKKTQKNKIHKYTRKHKK